jgi:hypothetical protein
MKALVLSWAMLQVVMAGESYVAPSTDYTKMGQSIAQQMSSGWLAGFIQRHTQNQDGGEGLILAQKALGPSFVDCTPLYDVERTWSNWILDVRVHSPLCAAICMDPLCSTSVPVFAGADNTLKTTQLCDVTVIGAGDKPATTLTFNQSATTSGEVFCRNIVDSPRTMQSAPNWSLTPASPKTTGTPRCVALSTKTSG